MKFYAKAAVLLIMVGIIAAFFYYARDTIQAQAEKIVCVYINKPSHPAKSPPLARVFYPDTACPPASG